MVREEPTNANEMPVYRSGRTPGISLPSSKLQEVVMRKAYSDAGLDFADTDYVECHGTGTNVGDPIEVDSVGRIFSPREGPPLLIGSVSCPPFFFILDRPGYGKDDQTNMPCPRQVKTNVGHSEGASGLTSILKVIQAFENERIPPSQGIVKLNPKCKSTSSTPLLPTHLLPP